MTFIFITAIPREGEAENTIPSPTNMEVVKFLFGLWKMVFARALPSTSPRLQGGSSIGIAFSSLSATGTSPGAPAPPAAAHREP